MTKISIKTVGYVALNGKNNSALLNSKGELYKTAKGAKTQADKIAEAEALKQAELEATYRKEAEVILVDCAAYAKELKLSKQKAAEFRRRQEIREAESDRRWAQICAADKVREVRQEKKLKSFKGMW